MHLYKRNPEQYVKRGIKPIMYINSNGEKEIFSSANELSKISLNISKSIQIFFIRLLHANSSHFEKSTLEKSRISFM